jgi:hypothetical protein
MTCCACISLLRMHLLAERNEFRMAKVVIEGPRKNRCRAGLKRWGLDPKVPLQLTSTVEKMRESMEKRKLNWLLWSGFLTAVIAFVSYSSSWMSSLNSWMPTASRPRATSFFSTPSPRRG